jgi:Tol biopolymer transport system component
MTFSVEVVDVASGRERVIASPGTRTVAPAWSPDGRQLAYIGGQYPESQLRVTGADGGRDHAVVSMRSDETLDHQLLSPAWSADGRTLYFLLADGRAFGGASTEVRSAAVGGGSSRRVAQVPPYTSRLVANSSATTLLLSDEARGPNQLLDVATGTAHRLRGPAVVQGTWESDDTIVGYEKDRLTRFELAGRRLRRIGPVPGFRTRSGPSEWFGVSVRHCGP